MPVKRSPRPAPVAAPPAAIERVRPPQQQRGERRVETILDAAATLIAEGGAESLTVQALADRAQTSKGSLYHFFPDLHAVVCALAERHTSALRALASELIADEAIPWSDLSLDAVIERFLAPLSYLKQHPDLLALARMPMMDDHSTRRLTPYRDLAAHILAKRCGSLAPAQRLAAAGAMVAIVDGIVGYGLRSDDVRPAQMATELRRALCAYLSALDTCRHARPSS
jgi:AcrR family transcriptional regulator